MSDHPIPREQWDRERMPDGTFRVRCSVCAKSVSNALAEPVIIRAWVMCPECIDSQAGLLQKIDAWAERERAADRVRTALSKKASEGQQPHAWTPDETKNKCLICGDGPWGRHRFQETP